MSVLWDFLAGLRIEYARFLQEMNWLTVIDVILVAGIFFVILLALRGTQAVNLLRGILLLVVIIFLFSGLFQLRAISWVLRNTFPALLFAIPVIFQPEIRRTLERLGRLGWADGWNQWQAKSADDMTAVLHTICTACEHLSAHSTGALIVLERHVGLKEYIDTGVYLDAVPSVELLEQIFYKDTPLHDGATFLQNKRIVAAAAVLPLTKNEMIADRELGLRHRAAIGITDISDALAVVVSEETGTISLVHNGRLIRHLDGAQLFTILATFYKTESPNKKVWWQNLIPSGRAS